jgi:hypothetical protein
VVLAVNGAIASATVQLGWLMSWGLQSLFFWTVFFQRHRLAGSIIAATAGSEAARDPENVGRALSVFYGARAGGRVVGRGRRAVGRGVGVTTRSVARVGRWWFK